MPRKILHQYWSHKLTGEVYAVEEINRVVTGVSGPLEYTEVGDLDNHDYDPDDAEWMQENTDEFVLYEPDTKRHYSLRLRLTDREHDVLKREADIRGQTLSAYARRMIFPTQR